MNEYRNKKILVAGAAGFVGVALTKKLVELGAEVRGTIYQRKSPVPIPSVEYIKVDLRKPEDCARAVKGMDYVFMAAANSSGAAVMERTPLVHLTPNLVMNALMLEAAYESQVRKFCFISSNTVYPLTDYPVCENDVNNEFFEKYFIVGWMKRFSELMCEMYSTKIKVPMETIVVRPGNMYGPNDKYTLKDSKVIAALIRRAIERDSPFKVWGDGMEIKDFLFIDDFIEGLLIVFQGFKGFEMINIASGTPLSIRQAITAILEATNYSDAKVIFDRSMPTMIPKRLINIDKALKDFGWKPRINFNEGIKRTVNWYREHYGNLAPENYDNQ